MNPQQIIGLVVVFAVLALAALWLFVSRLDFDGPTPDDGEDWHGPD